MATTHLLVWVISYMGEGSKCYAISAWGIGKKPSATIDTMIEAIPQSYVVEYDEAVYESKHLNMMTPARRTVLAIMAFLFNGLGLFLEKQAVIRLTEMRLHDFIMTARGKDIL